MSLLRPVQFQDVLAHFVSNVLISRTIRSLVIIIIIIVRSGRFVHCARGRRSEGGEVSTLAKNRIPVFRPVASDFRRLTDELLPVVRSRGSRHTFLTSGEEVALRVGSTWLAGRPQGCTG